ncbi:ATP-binding protein [Acidiphilium iwatense]|uniref:histidine kinase n=1 Tax=Acidiphilium iwatense TaxID=768198 RepID=A0ABS9DZ93_9PROT|nr:ATP-binding protein [Acidiphilium sp. AL]MCF3948061.1 ATP-binding protein [Acidiphilium iwatense]
MSRMPRLAPATLFGQTVLILLAGLVFSALLGISILAFNQATVVREMGAFAATQRIVNLARLIDDVPADWGGRLVRAASGETLQITLSTHRPSWAKIRATGAGARTIHAFLARQLPPNLTNSLHVTVGTASLRALTAPHGMMAMMHQPSLRGMPMMDRSGMPGMMAGRRMRAAVRLPSGPWVTFAVVLPPSGFGLSWPFLIALVAMGMIVVPASVWAVRRVTAPLRTLAEAAERLGRDVAAPPLAEIGSTETRQAAHAFNLMQARLRQLVESRTRMLAALSHDLRTPLTLLQLRVEDVQEVEERERMVAAIASMNQMIEATLAFARDDAAVEPLRRIDLAALLVAIVDDLADAGLNVAMAPAAPVTMSCQPVALRRAFVNLLDNAVKYGGSADVAIASDRHTVTVTIDDHGPGIPAAELSKVFEPFYRIEESRSRETGGSGLGLAIALAVVEAHGGTIQLANRSSGGLSVRVTLPR